MAATVLLCAWFVVLTAVQHADFSNGFPIAAAPRLPQTFRLHANPVNEDGSKYNVEEEEALQWFDEAYIHLKAGSGGEGATTFKFGKGRSHAFPNGGSGGNGGSIYFVCDTSINTLLGFRGHASFKAGSGEPGQSEHINGRKGADVRINMPMGSTVRDNSTGEILGKLSISGQELLVAQGGFGGRGNGAMKKVRGQEQKAVPPQPAEKRCVKVELQLVADVGLVGVPNAGKSTLLGAVTNARPKIASYAFTTIVPNIGVCAIGKLEEGGQTMVIADVPGLLEGAHRGVGLGRAFLRHIERCRIIIHVIDGSSKDPLGDFAAINAELELFSPTLAKKPQVVVLNKIDIPAVQDSLPELLQNLRFRMGHSRLIPISAAAGTNLTELMTRTHNFLIKVRQNESSGSLLNAGTGYDTSNDLNRVAVKVQENGYRVLVSGESVNQVLYGVDWQYYDALPRFLAASEALGIIGSLAQTEPPLPSGARVLFDAGDSSKEFVWSAEVQELLPLS